MTSILTIHYNPAMISVLKRLCAFFLFLFFVSSFFACSSNPKKPSSVSIKASRLQDALAYLTDAYEKKEQETFLSNVSPSFKQLDALRSKLSSDFGQFTEVNLTMVINWVEIRDETLDTTVQWVGVWKKSEDGAPLEKRGTTRFRWINQDHPILLEIIGTSPFGIF